MGRKKARVNTKKTANKRKNNAKDTQNVPLTPSEESAKVNAKVQELLLDSLNFVNEMELWNMNTQNNIHATRSRTSKIIKPIVAKLLKQTKIRRAKVVQKPAHNLRKSRKYAKPNKTPVELQNKKSKATKTKLLPGRRRANKRKSAEDKKDLVEDDDDDDIENKPTPRKRARQAKDCITKKRIVKPSLQERLACVRKTPPLTRSRLKQNPDEKLWELVELPRGRRPIR